MFRDLLANEIEVRVAKATDKGVSLILYKNARCDMNILDETVGAERWQRSHEVINGNLFCNVSIKFDNEWITKQDVGTESKAEAEKGEASDSFKRACFNWGIGRELYTKIFIWVNKDKLRFDKNGKLVSTFYVSDIKIDNKVITAIKICDERTNIPVFQWSSNIEIPKTEHNIDSVKLRYKSFKGSLDGFDEWYAEQSGKGRNDTEMVQILTQGLIDKQK